MNIIKFQNVSKQYKLYRKSGLYLRDRLSLMTARANPFNRLNTSGIKTQSSTEGDFLALKDVSFQIEKGETVGFIGRNGAGKSTILKLLASVTKPSAGEITINGRVAALIEVGAGFHPELTGRENIFLNGSILGMKKMEIQRCFDSIIHFSELEKFIDTPVKYYSSGMYVRLGFAVAAHTDPGIFLIDEVLAVGDDGFQRKCLDLLTSHKASGKTMILVSHQLNRIEEVCDRCIYLKNGQIAFDGDVPQAISRYKSDLTTGWSEGQGRSADVASGAHILEVSFVNQAGETIPTVNRDDELVVGIRYFASTKIMDPVFGIGIYGPQGEFISGFNTMTKSLSIPAIEGKGAIFCKLRCTSLICGTYNLVVQIHNMSDTITYDRQVYRFAIQGAYSKSRGLVDLQENWAFDSSFKQPLSLMHAGTHLQPANRLGSQC